MKKIVALVAMAAMILGVMLPAAPVKADSLGDSELCNEITDPLLQEAAGCNTTKKADEVVNAVLTVVLSFVGVIAVGVIIYGGAMYMTSNGDSGKIQRAKNIIMYGIIGMVVALLAYTIVHFVSQGVDS